jgi:hypothetical protein
MSSSIFKYSDPETVFKKAKQLKLGTVKRSTRREKKYMVQRPDGRWVHFGQMGYEDYTKHHDKKRRANYLTRSGRIKGDWKSDPYSANNLARKLLW